MSDIRFDLDLALARLATEHTECQERLKQTAAGLEAELRAVNGALAGDGPKWDVIGAASFHVFDAQVYQEVREGSHIELAVYGQRIGDSILARPLKRGRYRVILQLTAFPDEEALAR